ncbi:MAG TPA: tRNA uridine-5-carboxymethylaminomethyl(34) synthesis GTPase MnmE [Steroidobacteraceae bacterium]|nr:tRNA uridine-5-carboxymethylaminomethyl(34) synthesis GTPase MnmE [Steroidobacteraceae bacterium]
MEYQQTHRGLGPFEAIKRDTIVAVATPPGRGGVAVLRVSGAETERIAREMLGELPLPRVSTYAGFMDADGEAIDRGLASYFPAPNSYTGETVLELHAHGSPVVADMLLGRVLQLGARRALPGEFTQRAYLNAKLDLAQAEAVADLIDSASANAARAAMRSMDGEFSNRVTALSEQLGEIRVMVEAAIDFADEDIEVASDVALGRRVHDAITELQVLQSAGRRGRALTQGLTVVIVGRPNAGKSTLLNRLTGFEAAIVTDTPGTTRDVLRERITLGGLPLHVLDTAGLREASNEIEAEGIRRARAAMAKADRILFVVDAVDDPHADAFFDERTRLPREVPVTLLMNKLDLAAGWTPPPALPTGWTDVIAVSALTGDGLDALTVHLQQVAGFEDAPDTFSARARHLEALAEVATALFDAAGLLARQGSPELVAEELRRAQRSLGTIVGEESSDDLLGRIFTTFCIGK